jgi:hypothetical protein
MDNLLKDLFGFGGEPAAHPASPSAPAAASDKAAEHDAEREARQEARQKRKADPEYRRRRGEFFERYATGRPDENITAEEAIEHLAELREELTPGEFQFAMVQTLDNLPADQRDEFIALMRKHRESAQPVQAPPAASVETAAPGAAAAAAATTSATTAADPFGGLLTGLIGGGATRAGAATATGVPDAGAILDDLRKGGLSAPASGQGGQPTAADFLSLLNSPLGKAVLGGLAAYGMQTMQQKEDDDTPSQG